MLYGVRGQPGSPVEVRAVRLAALGASAATTSFEVDGRPPPRPRRDPPHVGRAGRPTRCPCGRATRSASRPEAGPLLVDEYDTTVVVPPGWSVRRHAATGTLVLEREENGG